MLDKHFGNITPFGASLLIDPKKLWRWYRDSLSGFLDPETVANRHRHDLVFSEKGKTKTIRVPILKPENVGSDMAIDEKYINGEFHTALSNRNSNKIAMLARSVRAKELVELLPKFSLKGFDVKSVTRDLSPSYDWFCRQAFNNAMHVADKFHIIKELLDATQDVRVRFRQELLTDKRLKYDQHKKQEHLRKLRCRAENKPYVPEKFVFKEEKADNGETFFELLARSRYGLYKYPEDWTDSQKQRLGVLFRHFPEIEKAYKLACDFRTWYRKENVGRCKEDLVKELNRWYLQVEKSEVMELENFKSLVQRHQGIILNYFVKGDTNAKAEALNSKIQRFITMNKGTRDIEFFYYRLEKLFA